MPPASCPEIAFWMRRRGGGGLRGWREFIGGSVDCRYVSSPSGVFQAAHVKPENRPGLENDAIKAGRLGPSFRHARLWAHLVQQG